MNRLAIAVATLALAAAGFGGALVLSTSSSATNTPTTTTTGGHTPVTICHKPGTPAQQELVVDDNSTQLAGHLGHGDTIGPCGPPPPPVDYCDTLPGVQAEDEDCPEPPVDECPNNPDRTEPPCSEEPPVVPTDPGPGHKCVFVGADKDGGVDKYGGTNDDCAPRPDPPAPATVTTTTPTPTAPPPVTTTTVPTPDAPPPPPVKAKPKAPKPDNPPTVKAAVKKSTKKCPAPAYMLNGKCVRDYKGKPHPVARGNG